MKIVDFIIPIFILFVIFYGLIKKVKIYDSFVNGIKETIPLCVSIFPYLVAIFILTELFEVSGLSHLFINLIKPILKIFGIPTELGKLILIKPFSGSGSLALLNELYTCYGVDSYIARCGSVIYGSSETIFYVCAVYMAKAKNKKLLKPIIISLVATFLSYVFASFICLVL